MAQANQPDKMKTFLKTFVTTGLAFGIFMGLFFGVMLGWQMALPAGLAAGVFFGLSMAGFTAVLGKRMAGKLPLVSGEEIIKEGPANHFLNGEGVGGWLTLTNRRLQFTAHKINVQVHEVTLPLEQIAGAQTAQTARIVPNGLQIKTASGAIEHFVVNDRAGWVDAIARTKGLRI